MNGTSIEEQVEFGLESIDPAETVEVPLRDLRYAYHVLGEFVRFFHQPEHYRTLEAVERFLGNVEQGAYSCLSQAYYEKLYGVWPDSIQKAVDDGAFDHPQPPYYLNASGDGYRQQ